MIKQKPTLLAYDGGQIDVRWDNHDDSVQWFEKHMGFKPGMVLDGRNEPDSSAEKMTQLPWGTWLKSVLSDTPLKHFIVDRGPAEPNVRWCWRTRDLHAAHRRFASEGVQISEIYKGPVTEYFDFWTNDATRLTAQLDPSIDSEGFFPSWTRIGVSSLDNALQWYQTFLGANIHEDRRDEGFIILNLALNHQPDGFSMWILETLPDGAATGPCNAPVRPYCYVQSGEEFVEYHRMLGEAGIAVSDIIGGRMRFFHFYDPDGNRFNVCSY